MNIVWPYYQKFKTILITHICFIFISIFFEFLTYSVYEGSRLFDDEDIFVDQYIYACGTNCSTCSMAFQEDYEIQPIFTDNPNPCNPYCQYNQVEKISNSGAAYFVYPYFVRIPLILYDFPFLKLQNKENIL